MSCYMRYTKHGRPMLRHFCLLPSASVCLIDCQSVTLVYYVETAKRLIITEAADGSRVNMAVIRLCDSVISVLCVYVSVAR